MPVTIRPLPEKRQSRAQKIISYENGFVNGTIRAYQQDLHLVLRPDDVWLATITQFSFYVNAHAEELRSKFVNRAGKEQLVLEAETSFAQLDVGWMARRLTCLMEEKLADKQIRNWLIPDFTTTNDNDTAVASMVMMATMKEYFDYACCTHCGFPSVTLLGDVADWERIVQRVEQLPQYGKEPAEWCKLLLPVVTRFVSSFRDPEAEEVKDFWLKVCYAQEAHDSGTSPTYTGWITAFTYWTPSGELNQTNQWNMRGRATLQLDGNEYPIIERSNVPSGTVDVPVKIAAFEQGTVYETTVVAGSVGVTLSQGGKDADGDTVQPLSGWWMLEDSRRPIKAEDDELLNKC